MGLDGALKGRFFIESLIGANKIEYIQPLVFAAQLSEASRTSRLFLSNGNAHRVRREQTYDRQLVLQRRQSGELTQEEHTKIALSRG